MRDRLENSPGIQRMVSRVSQLPSLPDVTLEVVAMLQNQQASVEEIGQSIAVDAAMSAKILQLANSAFFGSPTPISSVPQAVTFLGLDLLKPLVLSAGIFSHLNGDDINGISLPRLMSHGVAIGLLAREITLSESNDLNVADEAMVAGMLKDVGVLMLAQHFPKELNDAISLCHDDEALSLADAEVQVLGANHGEIGGYLLGLWGLPCPIIEAVAHYQKPSQSIVSEFCPLVAVHVASYFETESNPLGCGAGLELDVDFLTHTGLSDRVDRWAAVHASLTESVNCHA